VRGIVVLLATVLLLVFLCMRWDILSFLFSIPSLLLLLLHLSVLFSRRKRASSKACGQGGRPDTVEEVRHRKPFITNPSFTKTNRMNSFAYHWIAHAFH
jgi:hypothetical protein